MTILRVREMKRIETGVSYFGVRNPHYVEKDMEEIKKLGFDYVIHTFSENDYLYYRGTMEEIVKLTKGKGLRVYLDPWGVGRVFGGEAFSRFALMESETRQRISTGEDAPASCPNHPLFREFMKDWIDAIYSIGADGVFFDEPHFFNVFELPGRRGYTCTCERCQKLFRERYGYPMPDEENDDVRQFKVDSIRDFLLELSSYARGKELYTMLCLLPRYRKGESYWESFFKMDSLLNVGTDPYWRGLPDEDFEEYVRDFSSLLFKLKERYKKDTHIWIQGFSVKEGEEWKVRRTIEIGWEEGISNFAIWSYRGTEYMSYIRPHDPQKVWNTYIETIESIKG